MNWKLTLHYTDGTTEPMYFTTRGEARTHARYYRTTSLSPDIVIGKPVSRTIISKL